MSTIVIVEPTLVTLPYLAGSAAKLGHDVLVIYQEGHYPPDSMELVRKLPNIECNTSCLSQMIEEVGFRSVDWAGITTTADRFIKVACQLANHFDVPGLDRCVLNADKASTYLASPTSFPSTLVFDPRDPPMSALAHKLQIEGPFVCKPSQAAGGDGVFLITSQSQLDALTESLDSRFLEQRWLAQRSIDGTLMSIEGYVIDGHPHCIGVSSRSRYGFTEVTSQFPTLLDAQSRQQLRSLNELQRQFVSDMEFQNGYFHSEYLVNGGQAYLVDPNLGRLGGGGILHQVSTAFGLTPELVLAHVFDVTLFGGRSIDGAALYSASPRKTIFVQYGLREHAQVIDVMLPELSGQVFHTLSVQKGSILAAHGKNNRSLIGIVAGLEDDVRCFVDKIRIVTDAGVRKPFFGQ